MRTPCRVGAGAAKRTKPSRAAPKAFGGAGAIGPGGWRCGVTCAVNAISFTAIPEPNFPPTAPKRLDLAELRRSVVGQLRPIAATASLQAGCTPQRGVDSLLPTRPILLKMGNQIAVELDRHQFFRNRNATFSLRADGLSRWWRRWFEHSFGYGQGVGRSIPVRWSRHANSSIQLLTDTA